MTLFDATFKILARMQVNCDDEDDAREFIECTTLEEFRKLAISTDMLEDNIEVLNIRKL